MMRAIFGEAWVIQRQDGRERERDVKWQKNQSSGEIKLCEGDGSRKSQPEYSWGLVESRAQGDRAELD